MNIDVEAEATERRKVNMGRFPYQLSTVLAVDNTPDRVSNRNPANHIFPIESQDHNLLLTA